MCSILGGTKFNDTALKIYNEAKDRGRDFSGLCEFNGRWIANHRATPTNEAESMVENQPFGDNGFKIVHNGTIANDMDLGNKEGVIDSMVLAKVLDPLSIDLLEISVRKLKGSFAIALITEDELYLICNYKPIWWAMDGDGEIYFSSLKKHLIKAGLFMPQRVEPYTVFNPRTNESRPIKRTQYNKAIIVCSGGLDSTSVIGFAKSHHREIHLLHFDYGCKATEKEKEAIKKIASHVDCDYTIMPINFDFMKGNSTLFKDEKINSGKEGVEYALDWVPARNLILLSLATGFAEANQYGYIYLGSNLEEAGAYPDNEEQFILDFNNLLYGAVQNGLKVQIRSPLGGLMKREIVEFGINHKSPIHLSWSCYNGVEHHCGECAPCYMRKEAFSRAKVNDPTTYLK